MLDLAKIEAGQLSLEQHPLDLRDCVESALEMISVRAAEKRLVAYFVPGKSAPNASQLRAFVAVKLPDYMVPSIFLELKQLPLTPNGKVDRRALPAPDRARPELEKRYSAPRDEVELQLTKIWEQVLGVHPIGIEDKFFDLGGHSLLAVRVIAQMEKSFGRKLRLATIFQAPTIQQLAAIIRDPLSWAGHVGEIRIVILEAP